MVSPGVVFLRKNWHKNVKGVLSYTTVISRRTVDYNYYYNLRRTTRVKWPKSFI